MPDNLFEKLKPLLKPQTQLKPEIGGEYAAVTVVFNITARRPTILFVKRVTSDSDPWSGQIAFPGGRYRESDGDLMRTAIRELWEEAGIEKDAVEVLGTMETVSPGNRPTLSVTPFIAKLVKKTRCMKGPEIEEIFWVGVDDLRPAFRRIYVKSLNGFKDVPGFVFDDEFVWGMTGNILRKILAFL